MQDKRGITLTGVLLLLLIITFAFTFLNFRGTDDTKVWSRYIQQTQESGIVGGYESAASTYPYPPLSFVMLDLTARAAGKAGLSERTGIKLAIYGLLVATLLLFLLYTKDALLTSGLGLALLLNTVDLAYIDIFFAPTLVLALWALHKDKWAFFSALFAVSCLIKWQPLVLLPVFALYFLGIERLRDWRVVPWRRVLVEAIAPGAAVALAVLAVFGAPVFWSLREALNGRVISAQALNLNWILTYALNIADPATYAPLINGMPNMILEEQGWIAGLPKFLFWAVLASVLIFWFRAQKTFENLLLYLLLLYLTYFTLGAGAHENHLFPAVLIGAVLAFVNREHVGLFALWTLVANINLFIFYGVDGRTLPFSRLVWGFDTSILLAGVNVALYIGTFVLVVRRSAGYAARSMMFA